MSSIFGESAEEMVNRLCQEWLKLKIFSNPDALTSDMGYIVLNLKEFDEMLGINLAAGELSLDSDLEWMNKERKKCVLESVLTIAVEKAT